MVLRTRVIALLAAISCGLLAGAGLAQADQAVEWRSAVESDYQQHVAESYGVFPSPGGQIPSVDSPLPAAEIEMLPPSAGLLSPSADPPSSGQLLVPDGLPPSPVSAFPGWSGTQVPAEHWLRLNTALTDQLLDFQNRQTDKELMILRFARRSRSQSPRVIAGAQARLSFLAAATNAEDKFPYLGRFPTDFSGETATDARLLQANAHLTGLITPAINVYGELLFSDVFTFPDFRQGSLQMRQAFAVFGDLQASPFYVYIGKKNIGYGDFGTLSPFTQAVTWHYFAALAEGIGLGYAGERWDVTAAAINGGRGIRLNDSPERGKLNNLAVNATWHRGSAVDHRIQLGAGFLLGTIYDGLTAEHLDANQFGADYNSAWDVNGRVDVGAWSLAGEWVSTTRSWPVTDSPVSAYRTELAYWTNRRHCPSFWSVSWSAGDQGADGTEFEFNRQLVLGYSKQFNPYCQVSAEYVRSTGFAPLIQITSVSDRDVVQDSLVLGMTLVL